MTVQAQNSTQYYEGPIAVDTILSITEFTFIDNSHVSAKVRGESSTWEYGVDYLVAGANTLNRTLTVKKAVPEGSVLAIYLDVPITQGISPEEGGNFPASTNEFVLDKLTYICQMLDERLKRSLQISIDTPFSGTLPQPEPNKALKINAEGNGFVMSDYDPDTALVTTEEFKNQAQAAAQAAANSQAKALESANNSASSATQAQAIVDNGQVSINSTVAQGESTIASAVATGQQNITNIGNTATNTINQAVNEFKTYMNENPFSGKTIGEMFYTWRTDEINGAYGCNGQEFAASLFSGDSNPYNLLVEGKLPSKTYEEYQQELEDNDGVCGYFGIDTTNQKFKLPKLNEVWVEAGDLTTLGQYLQAGLPNIKGFDMLIWTGEHNGIVNNANARGGAFKLPTHSNDNILGGAPVTNTYKLMAPRGVEFDANLSSPIYQDSVDTVQTKSIKLRPMVQLATSATEVSFADYAAQFTNALNQAINTLSSSGQEYLQDLTPNKFVEFADRRKIKIAKNTFLKLEAKNYTIVGSPIVTETNIASGFTKDNYIKTKLSTKETITSLKYSIQGNFSLEANEASSTKVMLTITPTLKLGFNNLGTSVVVVDEEITNSEQNTSHIFTLDNALLENDLVLFEAELLPNSLNIKVYINNELKCSESIQLSLDLASIAASENWLGTLDIYSWTGSIDLKAYRIFVNNSEAYKLSLDPLWFVNTEDQIIEAESLLDEGSVFQNGKNYALYLVPNEAYTGVELKVSLNQTAPDGYSPLDTRRIAGWHTECADVGTVTWDSDHPLSGWLAGDILPQSVWTLYHRPYAPPAAGVVYVECGRPFWRTIYDHSGTLETTNFEYGGTITRNRTFYGHFKDMAAVGFSLPTYEQAALSGIGCEELKAVMGKAESSITTAGGHINESSHRIVSRVGAEDCVGCTWKPTTIAAIGGSGWNTDASVGVHQYGNVQLLHVGGGWDYSGAAGSLTTNGSSSALDVYALVASFGVSYPLPRKAAGIEI